MVAGEEEVVFEYILMVVELSFHFVKVIASLLSIDVLSVVHFDLIQ